jgi:hypothetical protein
VCVCGQRELLGCKGTYKKLISLLVGGINLFVERWKVTESKNMDIDYYYYYYYC